MSRVPGGSLINVGVR